MKCKKCGNDLEKGARFCESCGYPTFAEDLPEGGEESLGGSQSIKKLHFGPLKDREPELPFVMGDPVKTTKTPTGPRELKAKAPASAKPPTAPAKPAAKPAGVPVATSPEAPPQAPVKAVKPKAAVVPPLPSPTSSVAPVEPPDTAKSKRKSIPAEAAPQRAPEDMEDSGDELKRVLKSIFNGHGVGTTSNPSPQPAQAPEKPTPAPKAPSARPAPAKAPQANVEIPAAKPAPKAPPIEVVPVEARPVAAKSTIPPFPPSVTPGQPKKPGLKPPLAQQAPAPAETGATKAPLAPPPLPPVKEAAPMPKPAKPVPPSLPPQKARPAVPAWMEVRESDEDFNNELAETKADFPAAATPKSVQAPFTSATEYRNTPRNEEPAWTRTDKVLPDFEEEEPFKLPSERKFEKFNAEELLREDDEDSFHDEDVFLRQNQDDSELDFEPLPVKSAKRGAAPSPGYEEEVHVVVASLARRSAAGVIDQTLIFLFTGLFLTWAITVFGREFLPDLGVGSVAYLAILLRDYPQMFPAYLALYGFFFTGLSLAFGMTTGQTPGQWLLDMRVIQIDGEPLSFSRALTRLLGLMLSSICFLLGILWVSIDERKQGWHDKIAQTLVVRTSSLPEELWQ